MRSRRKPLNFYRIILDMNKNSLRIPNKFIRRHRKRILLSDVLIIVSDDIVWALGWMISSNGTLWLQKGWPEFAEHYRLKPGHLLLFNHLGKSVFHVRIFDPSSCEINYQPPTKSPNLETEIDQSVIQDDEHMSMTMAETEVLHSQSIFQETKASERVQEQRSRNSTLKSAKSFKSNNPFYSTMLTVSYCQTWGMYVPVGFLRRYLLRSDEKRTNVVLVVSDGGNWGPIKCRDYKTYGKLYGDNWKKFRADNHLGVGDVCYFELINEIKNVLKVTIFQAKTIQETGHI